MTKNMLMIATLSVLTTLAACSDDAKDSGDTQTPGTTTSTTPTTNTTSTTTATTTTTTTTTTSSTTTDTIVNGLATVDFVEYPNCTGNRWIYTAETRSWTDGNNLVNAWETGAAQGWNEEHNLPSIDFDPMGAWDRLERELEWGVGVANFQPDVNTVFTCGVHDVDPTMTFAVRVFDVDGNYADCAIFASDSGGVDAVFAGTAPNLNAVSGAAQLTAANCTEWALAR